MLCTERSLSSKVKKFENEDFLKKSPILFDTKVNKICNNTATKNELLADARLESTLQFIPFV